MLLDCGPCFLHIKSFAHDDPQRAGEGSAVVWTCHCCTDMDLIKWPVNVTLNYTRKSNIFKIMHIILFDWFYLKTNERLISLHCVDGGRFLSSLWRSRRSESVRVNRSESKPQTLQNKYVPSLVYLLGQRPCSGSVVSPPLATLSRREK